VFRYFSENTTVTEVSCCLQIISDAVPQEYAAEKEKYVTSILHIK
jgi:hypothetical protein